MAPTHISSTNQFNSLLSSNTYVIVDFYADWCGPCKTIAPIFEQLAATHTAAGKLAFCKVDVDAHQDIARKHGVSAMPTFLVFKNSAVANTIRGANPPALKSAVEAAARDAKTGPARQSVAFSSKGHVLGAGGSGAASGQSAARRGADALLTGTGFADTMVRFVALYFTSLFSLDAYASARDSPFSVRTGR
ncbi:thioredoxin-domain-containing protein [Rhizodiscina lignyota]|uniref:Thioredoxin-domain-containing protein n=1 Tax=Rhizodiscina lignyota TaxID=1504668 RepID=A0A9P4M8T2_9PEZI|nr:thioredoxin-domain-containing protein [Rhizodiscina lignyota]